MTTVRFAVSIALLTAALLYVQFFHSTEVVAIHGRLADLPADVGRWHAAEDTALDAEMLDQLRPTDYVIRRYVDSEGRDLWLFVAYWDSQRKGGQIHSPKNCLPGGGWEPLEASRHEIPLSGERPPLEVNYYLLQKGSDRQVVFYWFQSHGVPVASELRAKIELVRGSIMRNRSDGAIIRVSSPVVGTLGESSGRLVKYVQAMYPMLEQALPKSDLSVW
jgi:EpsI family protein